MKSVYVIKDEGKNDDHNKKSHKQFDLQNVEIWKCSKCDNLKIHFHIPTSIYFHIIYAYLIMMDSITLAASSHLSVTISITW